MWQRKKCIHQHCVHNGSLFSSEILLRVEIHFCSSASPLCEDVIIIQTRMLAHSGVAAQRSRHFRSTQSLPCINQRTPEVKSSFLRYLSLGFPPKTQWGQVLRVSTEYSHTDVLWSSQLVSL